MTERENLYQVLQEECGEIIQAASKIMRFGEYNHHPNKPLITNTSELMTEYYQLQAVMEILQENNILPVLSEKEIMQIKENKKAKVAAYAAMSVSLGLIKK